MYLCMVLYVPMHGCIVPRGIVLYLHMVCRIQESLLNNSVLHNREVLEKVAMSASLTADGRCFAV